jgi:predicted glycoside hydrolase/deacetylase ChbG (UPF0249 family)
MKYLIVNADDFGMSHEINEGIKRGVQAGIITSVSVMVNMPFYDEAVKFLKKHPEVSVGLHFNITEGSPILKPKTLGSLLREDNSFFHWSSLIAKFVLGKVMADEIKQELEHQYQKLKKTGLKISHIDSHHHMHLYPRIFRVLVSFAHERGVSALRSRKFSLWSLTNGIKKGPTIKQCVILALCFLDNFLARNSQDLYDINSIYDINWDKNLTEKKLLNILDHLPNGITEIICHPAVLSRDGNRRFLLPRYQRLELLLKKSVLQKIRKNNIQLVSRNELVRKLEERKILDQKKFA